MHLFREVRAGLLLSAPFLWLAQHVAGPGATREHLRLAILAITLLVFVTRPRKVTG